MRSINSQTEVISILVAYLVLVSFKPYFADALTRFLEKGFREEREFNIANKITSQVK